MGYEALTIDVIALTTPAAKRTIYQEIDSMSGASREDSATYAVTGTVLVEPVLLTLRRMAHEHLSAERFASRQR